MNKLRWRIAWLVAGAVVALLTIAAGDDHARWQAAHSWWAQAIALVSLQAVVAGAIWAILDERAQRCEA